MDRNKIALITGATAGIGLASAQRLSKENFDLILTGRRLEKLEKIKEEIENAGQSKVFISHFDIQDSSAVVAFIDQLPKDWKNIDVLINNAGLALGKEPIQDGQFSDWETMINTNVTGLLYITKLVSQLMIKNGSGHIVNLASTASTQVYANGNVYCATKHAVIALSKAMRIDLLPHGIKVSAVSPGAVDTDFSMVRFKGDKEKAEATYAGYKPLYAEDIADLISYVIHQPAHVNINDIEVTCVAQANAWNWHKTS